MPNKIYSPREYLQHVCGVAERTTWMLDWDKVEDFAIAGGYSDEDMERFDLMIYVYDEYKSVHGLRPRWMDFDAMTTDELRREADDLSAEIRVEIAREEAAEQMLWLAFHSPNYIVRSEDGEPIRTLDEMRREMRYVPVEYIDIVEVDASQDSKSGSWVYSSPVVRNTAMADAFSAVMVGC